MKVYVLFYDKDRGNREDWNAFYTPVEVFSTQELRTERVRKLAKMDDELEFHYLNLEMDVQ